MKKIYFCLSIVLCTPHLVAMQTEKSVFEKQPTIYCAPEAKIQTGKARSLLMLPDDVLSVILSYLIRPVRPGAHTQSRAFQTVLEDAAALRAVSKKFCLLIDGEKYLFIEYVRGLGISDTLSLLKIGLKSGRVHLAFALLNEKIGCIVLSKPLSVFGGDTPLHIAARYGYFDIVKFLCNRAGANVLNAVGQTPLHTAAAGGHMMILRFLLEHKGDVNAIDFCGNMSLHEIALNRALSVETAGKCARLLIDYGALVGVKNNNGETVYDIVRKGKSALVRSIKKAVEAREKHDRLMQLLGRIFDGERRPAALVTAYAGFGPEQPLRTPRSKTAIVTSGPTMLSSSL